MRSVLQRSRGNVSADRRPQRQKVGHRREAFILLHATGHAPETQRLYERLVRELESESIKTLLEDQQRFATLIDPANPKPDDLVWRYHRSVDKELEQRSDSTLKHALKLAEEVR